MYQTVYIDFVFVTNLVMNYILLRITGRCMKLSCKPLRLFLGALVGAVAACLLLLIPKAIPIPFRIVTNLILASLMILISWKVQSASHFTEILCFLYLAGFLCGGVWNVVFREFAENLPTFFIAAGLTFAVLFGCSDLYIYIRKQARMSYPVALSLGEKIIRIRGFYDTGNVLMDAYYHQPISIMRQEDVEPLLTNVSEEELRPHYIPYESIGAQGVMRILILEDMYIETPEGGIHVSEPFIGITTGKWVLGKNHQILLNANLLNN